MVKTTGAVIASIFLIGCTAAHSPTHYWEAADSKTEHQYKLDQNACNSGSPADSGEFNASSPEFEAYRECMINRGYVLRTY